MTDLSVVDRGAVGTAQVKPRPRSGRPPTLRQQRSLMVQRVLNEHAKSGTVPKTLRDMLVEEQYLLRWKAGEPLPRAAVERYVDEWAADLMSKQDQQT